MDESSGVAREWRKIAVKKLEKSFILLDPLRRNFKEVEQDLVQVGIAVKEALESGDSHTGCTVHFVDENVDTGPVIAQTKVPIQKGDTEDSLHSRIKEQEHILYPKVISDMGPSLWIEKLKS